MLLILSVNTHSDICLTLYPLQRTKRSNNVQIQFYATTDGGQTRIPADSIINAANVSGTLTVRLTAHADQSGLYTACQSISSIVYPTDC